MPTASLHHVLRHLRTLSEAQATRELSDGELLERFRVRREETAFALLVQRHGPMVLGVCRRLLADAHAAEDAFQATFLVLVRKAASIRKRDSVVSWLHGVARRIAVKARQRGARDHALERRSLAMPRAEMCDDYTWHELRAILDEELEQLPEKYRTPLVLCGLEGKTHEQAAQELGCPKSSLSSRLARARELLRDRLTRRGITVSTAALAAVLNEKASATVPALLTIATVQAAMQKAGEGLSASVATLTEEGVKAMSAIKAKAGLALVLMAAAISAFGYRLAAVGEPVQKDAKPAAVQSVAEGRQPKTDLLGDPLPEGAVARLGTVRMRHGGGIGFLRFTQDGKSLICSGTDGLRTWDTATGKQVRFLHTEGEYHWGDSISLSPDCTLLAAPGKSGADIWDIGSAKRISTIGMGSFICVCLSPDGKMLATQSRVKKDQIALWDVATGQMLRSWEGAAPLAYIPLVFTADSKTLIAGRINTMLIPPGPDQKRIHRYDVATGNEGHIDLGDATVEGVVPSPDGVSLAVISNSERDWLDRHVRLLDLRSGKETQRLTTKRRAEGRFTFSAIAFSADGKTLYTGGVDACLIAWDPATGKEIRRLASGVRGPWALAVSQDGNTVAAGLPATAIRLVDTATGKDRLAKVGHEMRLNTVRISGDGRSAVTASAEQLTFWDVATGRERRRIDQVEPMIGVYNMLVDGRTLLTQEWDARQQEHALRAWELATGKELQRTEWHAAPEMRGDLLALAPDGKTMVLGSSGENIVVMDRTTGKELVKMKRPGKSGVRGATFSPGQRTLITWSGDRDSQVHFWDLATGRHLRQFAFPDLQEYLRDQPAPGAVVGGDDSFYYVGTVAPDARMMACGGHGKFLAVYDLAAGQLLYKKDKLADDVSSLAFSPDSKILAWGGGLDDPTIHLLETATGGERHRLCGHIGGISCLAFSADGRILVSGSEDTTALVWDVFGGANATPLNAEDVEGCWADLSSSDAARAFRAVGKLTVSSATAVPLIKKRVPPIVAPDPKVLEKWITDLDSESFATRDAAMNELVKLDALAEPALRSALDKDPSPETRRRLEQLLAKLYGPAPKGESLRASRGIEALEHIATPEAREVLKQLAAGAAGAWQTREAKAALERLNRR
jgi:RNA polymerase sigma factor (sigma-70 family)